MLDAPTAPKFSVLSVSPPHSGTRALVTLPPPLFAMCFVATSYPLYLVIKSLQFVMPVKGKSHQLPFPMSNHVVKTPLELIYSDVWGHAQTSVSGHNYYVSFAAKWSLVRYAFITIIY